MLYLLQSLEPDEVRQVPFAERTLVALERALLALNNAERRNCLADAIAGDPALASRVAYAARQMGDARLTTAAAAAEWLADRLADQLVSAVPPSVSDGRPAMLRRVPPEEAKQHADAYAAILVRATDRHAERRAPRDAVDDEAYFAEIVAAGEALWSQGPTAAVAPERLLPTFPELATPRWGTGDVGDNSLQQTADRFLDAAPGSEWRLPALVALLAAHQRQLAEFDRRLEHEKLESLKELAYGASHEINNPLANIAARAQTLLRDETDTQRRRKLAAIHRQAMRAHEMIADLMLFARPPRLDLAVCDVGQIARDVVDELADLAVEREIEMTCEAGDEAVELDGDATQLAVALQAVVVNALEAASPGGHVEVVLRTTTVGNMPWAEIVVEDDGPGISEEVRRHLFDPFFSGREAGRGLGFGLSKCWRIVTDHGGQVVVGTSGRRGARLSILLPLGTRATSS